MTASGRDRARALSFGAAAAAYERGRPSYPGPAVSWLLPPGARRVADVGAGTGKLTRRLRARGLEVVAVEPVAQMRAEFARAVPGVPVLAGTAEDLPLESGSVDAVLVAQAWHWVDPARAVPEAARVLVPGGQLGLIWNVRDERVGWVAELSRLMRRDGEPDHDRQPSPGPPFGPPERLVLHWASRLTQAALLDLVASRSYVITRPAPERAEILANVRRLLESHPALAGASEISLPYVTLCTRARLTA
jgi:SAM-dependent methyltransferase